MTAGSLSLIERPVPQPGPGRLLLRTIACGVCGTDLHLRAHGREYVERGVAVGSGAVFDADREVIMGHEFVGEVVGLGDGVEQFAVGQVVTSMPTLLEDDGVQTIGLSNRFPGGFAEYLVAAADRSLLIPAGIDPEVVTLTEPYACARHAVAAARSLRGGLGLDDTAVVIGCGPIGLLLVAALREAGLKAIVASDRGERRRELAAVVGAAVVADPNVDNPFATLGQFTGSTRPPLVFEAVGVPGVLNEIFRKTPKHSDVIVAGLCMQSDVIEPQLASEKELTLRFALGWTPDDFLEAFDLVCAAPAAVAPIITRRVPLTASIGAMDDLAAGGTCDGKVLVVHADAGTDATGQPPNAEETS